MIIIIKKVNIISTPADSGIVRILILKFGPQLSAKQKSPSGVQKCREKKWGQGITVYKYGAYLALSACQIDRWQRRFYKFSNTLTSTKTFGLS